MFFEKHKSPFVRMATGAVSGSALGIFFGLIFSVVITLLSQQFDSPTGMMMGGPQYEGGFSTFIGMGFGAIIGAILGGASGIKNS